MSPPADQIPTTVPVNQILARTTDVAIAVTAVDAYSTMYAGQPNYQRIMELGGASGAPDAAIVGDEGSVRDQLQGLIDAGATDIWAAIIPVGEDRRASTRRTTELLQELLDT